MTLFRFILFDGDRLNGQAVARYLRPDSALLDGDTLAVADPVVVLINVRQNLRAEIRRHIAHRPILYPHRLAHAKHDGVCDRQFRIDFVLCMCTGEFLLAPSQVATEHIRALQGNYVFICSG